jgi:hypothetical protein
MIFRNIISENLHIYDKIVHLNHQMKVIYQIDHLRLNCFNYEKIINFIKNLEIFKKSDFKDFVD